MNHRMQRSLVSIWTLVVCLVVLLGPDASQQDPTWIDGVYDAADHEADGHNTATRALDTPATDHRTGFSGHMIKVDSFEGLTRSESKEYGIPDALPDVRGSPGRLLPIAPCGDVSLPLSVGPLAVLARSVLSPKFETGEDKGDDLAMRTVNNVFQTFELSPLMVKATPATPITIVNTGNFRDTRTPNDIGEDSGDRIQFGAVVMPNGAVGTTMEEASQGSTY
jgi:hypothetical protein